MKSEIFSPEFIPIYMEEYVKHKLSPIEWLVYGFIRFYTKRGMDFYYTSEQLSEIVSASKWTVDNAILGIKKKWLICVENTSYWTHSVRKIILSASLNNEPPTSSNDGFHLIKRWDKKEWDKKEDNINIITIFENFWEIYPRKIWKPKALLSFKKIKDQEKVIEGTKKWSEHWKESGTEMQYIPHPTTFLNQERYNDEVQEIHRAPKNEYERELDEIKKQPGYESYEDRQKRMEEHRRKIRGY